MAAVALGVGACGARVASGEPPAVVTCPPRDAGMPLSGWDVVEGDPRGSVILAPDRSERDGAEWVNRWDLLPYDREALHLRCSYRADGSAPVLLKLAPPINRCEARGTVGPDGKVAIPMTVRCD